MINIEDKYNKIAEFSKYLTDVSFSRKNFLKSLAIFAGSLLFLGKTESAFAHPPSDIVITFDAPTKTLKAVIIHPVSNPNNHFINKVHISLNGQEIIEHRISKQDNNTDQTVSYLIPDAKEQDTLAVEAHCSISGALKKKIKVGD